MLQLVKILAILAFPCVALAQYTVPTFTAGALGTTPQVATPTFSPGAGTYSSTQSITISTVTALAVLCYTTDGSTPTESGNLCSGGTTQTYTTPVSVASSLTLKAIGTLATYTDSSVGSAVYTISSCPYTYAFPGSGALPAAWAVASPSTWTHSGATIVNNSGVGQSSTEFRQASELITGSSCSFPLDQSISMSVVSLTTSGSSSIAWMYLLASTSSTASGYQAQVTSSGTAAIFKWVSGTQTTLSTGGFACSAYTVGHSLSFAISGSGASQKETLTDTTSSTQMCQVTDNSLTSGYPGIGVSPNDLVTQVQLGSVSAD